MNWLNLNIQTLDSEEFIGSEPIDRATWLCLLRFCIGQENGGIITDCAEWGDRKWQQLVRVTKEEAWKSCDLWSLDGDNLIVWGYPVEKEDEVQQKRERARTNGASGGRPRKTNIGSNEKPTLDNSAKAEGERKGKELEGERERELKPALPLTLSLAPVVSTGRRLPDHAPTITRINALRSEWAKPAQWTGAELHALHDALGQIEEFTEEDWAGLKRYFAARIEPGAGFWQPKSRGQFVASLADVYANYVRWSEKTGNTTTPKKKGWG